MEEFIEIGKVVSTKGLDGTIKILSEFNSTDFCPKTNVKILGEDFLVKKISRHKNFLLFLLDGVSCVEQAQKLVGSVASVKRENIVLKNGDYLVDDLLNMQVKSSIGEELGKLVSVENFGSKDVWTTKLDNREFVLSLIEGLIEKVDYENKVITLNSQKLCGVMYEN